MPLPPEPRPPAPLTLPEALARLEEAENTLRAIGAGEVDAFVVSDGGDSKRVFTLATADRPYRMFVENMHEGAATLSPSGVILYANRRLAEILGRPRQVLVGTPLLAYVATAGPVDVTLLHPERDHGATLAFDLIDAGGQPVPVLVGSSPLKVDGTDLVCLTFTDISAQKAQESEIARLGKVQGERVVDLQNAQALLMRQATHDALTDLPNRSLLVDRIDQALAHSRRSGRSLAVLFVDLDGFKTVNDTKGHAAGDRVLCTVAERLAAALRGMDTVARVGGDEFAILAPEIEDRAQALDISARLIAALGEPDPDGSDAVRASVGMTVSVAGRGTAEVLLYEADTAMYQAKSLGGQRVELFDVAFGRQLIERAGVRRMLQSALDDRRVTVHYQPIVDLPSGRVAGYEALARIRLAEGAILSPADFIPIAESSGLILPLGTQVLELACQQASGWQDGASGSFPAVAVNLSARQLEPGNLTDVVLEVLERTGLAPDCLHFELTETATFDLRPALLRQLGLIADLGVQIGLDDFGTGYASLTHLRRLPVTFVKIDQSFVQGMATGQEDDRIVSAVVDLAANLGLRSIAEGVETQAQRDRLQELGCDQAQGYLFARPLPADQLPPMIASTVPPITVRERSG